MERDKALMIIGIVLTLVGIVGLVLPVELILNLHHVGDYLVLIDPTDTYPYEPDNMLTYSYFTQVYIDNFLELAPISTLLVAVGIVGVLVRYRNYIAILSLPGFIISAQQTTFALHVYQDRSWPLSLEYWNQMIPQINTALLLFVIPYLVLGVTLIPTKTSFEMRFNKGVVLLCTIIIILSILSVAPYLMGVGRLWITQSITSILAMVVFTVLLFFYLSVPSTQKYEKTVQKV